MSCLVEELESRGKSIFVSFVTIGFLTGQGGWARFVVLTTTVDFFFFYKSLAIISNP